MADVAISIATAMASGFLKLVLTKCGDAISKTDAAAGLKSALLGNLKPKLEELQRELGKLEEMVSRAERLNPEQLTDNKLLSPWLKKIKEAATYAENLLEEISYYHLAKQVEGGSKVGQIFRASDGTSIAFRHKIGSKLNNFKSMAADIYKAAAKINPCLEFVKNASDQPAAAAKPTMSTNLSMIRGSADTSIVVGRDREEEEIVGELCRTENDKVLGVIAMVGMSGVGKTTLARKIYDNETVKRIYKKKSWIFVSRDYNLKRLLDEMLQSVTEVSHNMSNIDAMENKLQGCLQKERYLIVLDDVWNTDKGAWGTIRSSLVRVTAGCTDSKVLVTTQSFEVASVMDAYLMQKIDVLSNDDAWALFERQAFANKSQHQVSELRCIGERILRKCGGLPLAINTLASLLKSMNNKSQWENVEKDPVWKSSLEKTKIMPWLLLSFNHLPDPETKRCFALCSILIPKVEPIITEESLIESWIAHGFINSASDNPGTIVNAQCLRDRNLLKSAEVEKQNWFTIHDLMRDLALYVSMGSCFNLSNTNDLSKASTEVEHVLIDGCNSAVNFPEGSTQSTLRTLICLNSTISINLVAQASFLRQLHLQGCGLTEIPSSIGGLKLLRILNLQDNPFKSLPAAIGKLYNLQQLYLKDCTQLVELPQQITKLINLRTISKENVYIPEGMGQLACLTHLPGVKLKPGDGSKIKELGSLLHLRGQVRLEQLESIRSKEEATYADLKNKQGITELILMWTHTDVGNRIFHLFCNDEEVMEGLQPPSTLTDLWVSGFDGTRFSPWLSDGLYCNSLTRLALVNCKKCEQLPTLGCLPYLEDIFIAGMVSVEVIGGDFFGCSSTGSSLDDTSQRKIFPSVKEFSLLKMPNLKEWVDPLGSYAEAFPCLEKLVLQNCSSLVTAPTCFQSLQQLTVEGVDSDEPLQIILSNSDKLTSLTVKNVENLTRLTEPLLNCTSLQFLEIDCCKELVELPSSLQSLGCLETLQVIGCDSLTSLPDVEGLLSLRKLGIILCDSITATPRGLESCVSIEELHLLGCPKLSLIPDLARLSRLHSLHLMDFSEQISIARLTNQLSGLSNMLIGGMEMKVENLSGISQLPKSLKTLSIAGAGIKNLPDELQSLTQLERLDIYGSERKHEIPEDMVESLGVMFPELVRILEGYEEMISLPEWIGNLSSLQILDIRCCKNLKNLPSLNAIRRLTQLRTLIISQCPELEDKCRKNGEEWSKICHIPTIFINDKEVVAS